MKPQLPAARSAAAAPRAGSSQKQAAPPAEHPRFQPVPLTGRDPLGLGKVVGRLVAERGWTSPVAVGSVMADWATLVGPEIAAHCTPESFTDTTLHVRCDSTAWATQLRLLSISLPDKFRTELGDGVVTSIKVLGPAAPNWRKGDGQLTAAAPGTRTDSSCYRKGCPVSPGPVLTPDPLKNAQTACRAFKPP